MPSVFTIDGTSRPPKKAKPIKTGLNDAGHEVGYCKKTKNGRKLCYVGKSKKHPSGWAFQKK